ncbi:MAG TPA: InlB B-repeat-containing protein [Clostridiales bacterium]|nr:InlB B-repeat-containing protein [Clostridiales bacterium]
MKGKRLTAFITTVAIIVTSFAFAIPAFAVSVKQANQTSGDLTFIVPEAIYLVPNGTSWRDTTSAPFQYYVNNTSTGGTTTTLDDVGKIYFTYPNISGSASLSYTNYDANISSTLSGSVTLSSTSISSGGSVNINGGNSPSLSASTTGYYIEWCATFTDSADGLAKKAYAYTYVYKPYTVPVGASSQQSGYNKGFWAAHVSWISGIHSISEGEHSVGGSVDETGQGYAKIGSDGGLAGFISTKTTRLIGSSSGTGATQPKIPPGSWISSTGGASYDYVIYAESGNNNASLDNSHVNYDPKYMLYGGTPNTASSFDKKNYSYSYSYAGLYRHATNVDNACSSGNIIVDVSRYNDFSQIPNLKIGHMVTQDASSGGNSGSWYVADASTRLDEYTSANYYNNDTNRNNAYYTYSYIIACQATGPNSKSYDELEGIRYAGSYPHTINTNESKLRIHTYYGNANSNKNRHADTHVFINLNPSYVNKAALRTAVQNATKLMAKMGINGASSGTLQSHYFDTTAGYNWTAFTNAYKAAVIGLTKLDATCDAAALAANLNSAIDNLATRYTVNPQGGVFNGSSSATSIYVDVGTNAPSINTSITVIPAIPTRTGYTFIGWSKTANGTRIAEPNTAITLGYNETLYALWKPTRYAVSFNPNHIGLPANRFTPTFVDDTKSGVTFTYNPETNVITLNGTATGSYVYNLVPFTFQLDTDYIITAEYVGGTISASSACCVIDITQADGTQYQNPNRLNMDFAGHSTATKTFTVTSSLHSTAAAIKLWFWKSGSLSFDNYQFKVTVTPKYAYTVPAKTATYSQALGTLPIPKRDGYTFVGWFDAASGGTQYTASTVYNHANDITLYAHWVQNNYTVAYDLNGGTSDAIPNLNATFNVDQNFPTDPERVHTVTFDNAGTITTATATSVFQGWLDENPVEYTYFTRYPFDTANYSEILNPAYYANRYGDLFNAFAYDRYLLTQHYVRYTHFGNETRIGTGTDFPNYWLTSKTNVFKNLTIRPNETVTLKAKWALASVALPTVTHPIAPNGYIFGGWYSDSACNNFVGNAGDEYTPTADTTLYAKWTIKTYTVNYYDNTGLIKTETVNWGANGTPPTANAKYFDANNHYTFTGWPSNYMNVYADQEVNANYSSAAHTKLSTVIAATCTEPGNTHWYCQFCEWTDDVAIDPLGHVPVVDAAVAPTCTATGLTEGSHCSRCSAILVAQTAVAALGHSWSDYVYNDDASCLSAGTKTRTCTRQGCSATETVTDPDHPALGHSFINYVYNNDASCTAGGTKTAKCERCTVTDTVSDPTHPAKGHNYVHNGTWQTNPTCTVDGIGYLVCTNSDDMGNACGHTTTGTVPGSALGHNPGTPFNENVIPPTCTEDGSHDVVRKCTRCQVEVERITVVDEKINHANKIYTSASPATCTANGNTAYYSCPDCSKYFSDAACTNEIAYGSWVIPAGHRNVIHVPAQDSEDCTTMGNIEYWFCDDCDKYYKTYVSGPDANGIWVLEDECTFEETRVTAHHLDVAFVAYKAPTCTATGLKAHYFCSACSNYAWDEDFTQPTTLAGVTIAQLGHSFTNYLSNGNATCTADGTKTAVCDRDGCSVTDTVTDTGSKFPHVFTNYTYNDDATCFENGTETAFCEYGCGTSHTREKAGTQLSHNFETYIYNNDHTCTSNGTETATCTICQTTTDTREKPGTMAHTDLNFVAAYDAQTCTEESNIAHYYCGACQKYYMDEAATINVARADVYSDPEHLGIVHHEYQNSTCTAAGNIEYWSCSVCSKNYSDAALTTEIALSATVIPASHKNITYHPANNPTDCFTDGNYRYWQCGDCHKIFSNSACTVETTWDAVIIPASHLGMVHHAPTVGANCVTEGTVEYWECTVCDNYYSDENGDNEILDVGNGILGPHSFVHQEAVAPNCLYDGHLEHWVCSVCGIYSKDSGGHDLCGWEALHLESTGEHHVEWNIVHEATCTESGFKNGYCTGCGMYIEQNINPSGHKWAEWYVVEVVNCETGGTEARQCTKCSAIEERHVDPIPHYDSDGDGICDACRTILTYIPIDTDDPIGDSHFRCSKCDWYEQGKDTPGSGFFIKIIHFFVHFIEYIIHRF